MQMTAISSPEGGVRHRQSFVLSPSLSLYTCKCICTVVSVASILAFSSHRGYSRIQPFKKKKGARSEESIILIL